MSRPRGFWWQGLLAFACYAGHAGYFLAVDRPSNLLWGCHMATLGIGLGLITRSAVWNSMGVVALLWGVPVWIYDLVTGGEFIPTSLLTHVVGLGLGLWGSRRLGFARRSWLRVTAMTLVLILLCRLTDPAENVNLAFGPPPGYEHIFPPQPWFGVILLGGASAFFLLWQVALRALFGVPPGERAAASADGP